MIRDAIHLPALANRVWPEPLVRKKRPDRVARPAGEVDEALEEVWAEAARYE